MIVVKIKKKFFFIKIYFKLIELSLRGAIRQLAESDVAISCGPPATLIAYPPAAMQQLRAGRLRAGIASPRLAGFAMTC
jgi:hypothetical protein